MPVPFDHSFKLLTDDDPRAALAAFANIPLDAEIEVEPADRELNLSTLKVDNLYRCRRNGAEFIIHFEAVSRYRDSALDRQADYVRAIVSKYKLPCRSYILLLTEEGVPDHFPRHLESGYGDYQARIRLRPVRLWRMSASRILRLGRLALYPWVPLMNASPEEVTDAARRLIRAGDRVLIDRMSVLGGLRYGTKELFAERFLAMTTEEILQDSPHYQLAVKMAEKRGVTIADALRVVLDRATDELIAEVTGWQKGRQEGERQMLTRQLTARFGPLPAWASKKIGAAGIESLEAWSLRLLTAASLEESLS